MSSDRPSERLRSPQPILRTRLPSRRGAMEQPNVTDDGEAGLTPRFWIGVVLTGVATGLLGALMMVILSTTEHLAFNYGDGSLSQTLRWSSSHLDLQAAVERASDTRRLLSLVVAGLVGGPAWYLVRRHTKGVSEVDEAVWAGDGRLAVRRSLGTAVISELVIGMGASIGREAAPKLLGGVSGSVASDRLGLTTGQRRLLVACGGGAGLACVYNVPLGGSLFAAELLLGSLALPVIMPAVACSFIATLTAWLYLPQRSTYLDIPTYHFTTSLLLWAVLIGIIIGFLSTGYIRLIGWVSHRRFRGRLAIVTPLIAFTILGLIGFAYPQLFGNGKDMAHMAFIGQGGLLLFLALFALKPLVTAMCLGSGASGGLFTPTMSTGAMLGGFLGLAWTHLWSGTPVGAFAIVGATAMIGASMQAPLAALALVLELTHNNFSLMVPMMAATIIATVIARTLDGYSIYSARLPARPRAPSPARP